MAAALVLTSGRPDAALVPQREPVAVADHGDVALMEGLERRAVADRDDGGMRAISPPSSLYSAASEGSSSEAVASSRNRYFGACNSARASPRRCCSPSESIRFQCASSSSRGPSCGRPTIVSASLTWSALKLSASPG